MTELLGSTAQGLTTRTEAPTNAGTHAASEARKSRLTEEQLDFVTMMDYYWGLNGTLMSMEYASEKYGLVPSKFKALMGAIPVKEALVERGVKITGASTEGWAAVGLTPSQLLVANTMMNILDTRSDKKKLQDLGVSLNAYQSWLRDPVFSSYLRERGEALLGDSQHEASLALVDKVRSGDVKAIGLYLEVTGRYVKQTGASANDMQAIDFKNVIMQLVEIITEEVTDPQIAARIADRIKGLITTRTIAGALTGEDPNALSVTVPQVAKARVMTPELQALMDGGVGNE